MSISDYSKKIQMEIIPWIIEKNLSLHLNESLKSTSSSLLFSAPEMEAYHVQDFFAVLNLNSDILRPIESDLSSRLKEAAKLLESKDARS